MNGEEVAAPWKPRGQRLHASSAPCRTATAHLWNGRRWTIVCAVCGKATTACWAPHPWSRRCMGVHTDCIVGMTVDQLVHLLSALEIATPIEYL